MLKVRFFGLLRNKNMPSKIPQVGSEQGVHTQMLLLPCEDRSLILAMKGVLCNEVLLGVATFFSIASLRGLKLIRSHNTDGITPYMFISSLLRVYGSRSAKRHSRNATTLHWKEIRRVVSPILVMPELDVNAEEITDTDKIISTMFQILRKEKLMKKVVPEGEELMPNRVIMASPVFTEANKPNKNTSTNPVFTEAYKLVPVDDSRLRLRITQVKKMSKNHGKVLREASDIGNSPEIGDANIGDESLKRKLL
ncbi:hypothetical protein CQW23_01255 [Capsicum baccatum]|uniref:Non-structural maintenance of chromosomes element 4 n=1 Tax=Capsicum baccatum TaxID=33114 RepID=A0A2G2XN28_CAPBA|nr:hypothetical protein CQW23_01255 [Capsicum baccatum]